MNGNGENVGDSIYDPDSLEVKRCLGGDPDAYRGIVQRHQQKIAAMMWRFSRDRTVHEDLVQEVFVQAYLGLDGWKAKAPLSHWLARIATRVGYRYWKRQRRERRLQKVPLQDWDLPAGGGADQMEPVVAAEYAHYLLAQLPPRDRLVLTLRFLDDCSVEETAGLTGMSKTMVKVQTWRAKKKFKKVLKKVTP